jgi:hypothetical protein
MNGTSAVHRRIKKDPELLVKSTPVPLDRTALHGAVRERHLECLHFTLRCLTRS